MWMQCRQQNASSRRISSDPTRSKVSPTMEKREIHWFYDESIAKSKGAYPSSKWNQTKVEKVSLKRFRRQCIPMIHHEVPHRVQIERQEEAPRPQRILLEHDRCCVAA
jgi:hypothetical protein